MTSIEWLENELIEKKIIRKDNLSTYHDFPTTLELLFEQSKEMHKKEIIDAVGVGSQFDRDYLYGYHDKAEQYYQETFVSKGSDEVELPQQEISDEEIEAAALTFAEEESYGELSTDLWKGYVFGAKRMRDRLKQL